MTTFLVGILILLMLFLEILLAVFCGLFLRQRNSTLSDPGVLLSKTTAGYDERNTLQQTPLPITKSTSQADRPVNVHGKSNELVPYNLNETDKKILELFYEK
jgi:hypothetical protein